MFEFSLSSNFLMVLLHWVILSVSVIVGIINIVFVTPCPHLLPPPLLSSSVPVTSSHPPTKKKSQQVAKFHNHRRERFLLIRRTKLVIADGIINSIILSIALPLLLLSTISNQFEGHPIVYRSTMYIVHECLFITSLLIILSRWVFSLSLTCVPHRVCVCVWAVRGGQLWHA